MTQDLDEKLKDVITAEPRYKREAYYFVFESLRFTVNRLGEQRHVTGQELLEGIRDYAQEQFGGLARLVLQEWGVCNTEDFGKMVFVLVEHGLMGKTNEDSLEDFRNAFDFDKAFPIDFSPPTEPSPS